MISTLLLIFNFKNLVSEIVTLDKAYQNGKMNTQDYNQHRLELITRGKVHLITYQTFPDQELES